MSKKEWELVDKMMVGDFGAYHSEGTPVNDSVVTEDMSKVMDMTYGVFDEDGAWKTINGAHVYIEGGEITKGPAALTGKKSEGKKSAKPKAKEGAKTNKESNFPSREDSDGTRWIKGKVDGQSFEAKVYPEGSMYGILGGSVSKLEIRDKNNKVVIGYDRGDWYGNETAANKKLADKIADHYDEGIKRSRLIDRLDKRENGKTSKVKGDKVDVSKGFPKIVKYDGAEYYKAEEFSDGSKSYVRWDDNNNAQYITVSRKGEIERN